MQFVLPQLSEPLKLWERIEIAISKGTASGRYVARIEDFAEGAIVISRPEFVDGGALLWRNNDVTVLITREDAVYQFRSRIKQVKTSTKTIHLLMPPDNVRRVQRRQFVRIELHTKVSYANLTTYEPGPNDSNRFKWRQSKGIDISGSGILMKTKEDMKLRDLLLLRIACFGEIDLPKTIVGVCRRVSHEKDEFSVGVEFIRNEQLGRYFNQEQLITLPESVKDFDQTAQNKLAAHIFHQQIELRKKGLL